MIDVPTEQREKTTSSQPSRDDSYSSHDRAGTTTCEFCGQHVARTETVTLSVSDEVRQPVCTFCAASLFEDIDAEEIRTETGAPAQHTIHHENRAAQPKASEVTWTPTVPQRTTGTTGRLMRMHYFSLSLLWSIHQTNVRLFERILDEIDVQQVTVLVVLLMVVATLASVMPA